MRDALNNIRLAFVQIKGAARPIGRAADRPIAGRLNRPDGASRTRSSTTVTSSDRSSAACSPTSFARSWPAALTTRHHGTSTSVVARMRPTSRDRFG